MRKRVRVEDDTSTQDANSKKKKSAKGENDSAIDVAPQDAVDASGAGSGGPSAVESEDAMQPSGAGSGGRSGAQVRLMAGPPVSVTRDKDSKEEVGKKPDKEEHKEEQPEKSEYDVTKLVQQFWDKLENEVAVILVMVIAMAMISYKFTPLMLSATVFGALVMFLVGSSLYKREYFKHTVVLLVLLTSFMCVITPDKTPHNIEACTRRPTP